MKIAMMAAALALAAPAAVPNPFPAQPVPAPYGGVTRSSRYVAHARRREARRRGLPAR